VVFGDGQRIQTLNTKLMTLDSTLTLSNVTTVNGQRIYAN